MAVGNSTRDPSAAVGLVNANRGHSTCPRAGEDLKRRPLDERRKALRKLTCQLGDAIRFSETFDASPADMIAVVREQGLEGVVAKLRDSPLDSY